MNGRFVLYRHFGSVTDESGSRPLLYVGQTSNFLRRLSSHKNGSHWLTQVELTTYEWFDSLAEVMEAEAAAIFNEAPRFNSLHRKDYPKNRTVGKRGGPLHDWMEKTGVTRKALAADLGVTTSMISGLRTIAGTHARRPSLKLAMAIEARTGGEVSPADWPGYASEARP